MAQRLDLDADAAGAAAGTLLAALTLATVLAALPAGWLADRIGRGPLMLLGGGAAMLGMALLPLAESLNAMLVLGTLIAIGTASFGAGNWAILADLAAGQHSGRLLGLANLGTAGAGAAAGLLGLVIEAGDRVAPGTGYAVAFVLAAAVALAGGVLGWRRAVAEEAQPRVAFSRGSIRRPPRVGATGAYALDSLMFVPVDPDLLLGIRDALDGRGRLFATVLAFASAPRDPVKAVAAELGIAAIGTMT